MGLVLLVIWVFGVSLVSLGDTVNGIGANWGTQASHQLPPDKVVRMLRENGIQKVKLFDADYGALRALSNSGIEVMVGIPNEMLLTLARSSKAADKWVAKNVSAHLSNNVNIRLAMPLLSALLLIFFVRFKNICLFGTDYYKLVITVAYSFWRLPQL